MGDQHFGDIDGLAFEPYSGLLFASVRRIEEDLLIQVDPTTGKAVANAFGPGKTYIPLQPYVSGPVSLGDIDDIAIDLRTAECSASSTRTGP
ncbi:MAG: hypothetical protein ACI9W4_000429 [Rhodothermales bacterium]